MRTTMQVIAAVILFTSACGGSDSGSSAQAHATPHSSVAGTWAVTGAQPGTLTLEIASQEIAAGGSATYAGTFSHAGGAAQSVTGSQGIVLATDMDTYAETFTLDAAGHAIQGTVTDSSHFTATYDGQAISGSKQ